MRRLSFRTLTADVPGELLAAQVASTGRTSETTLATEPTYPGDAYVYELLGILADNPGVIDHDTLGFPALNAPAGDTR